MGLQLFLQTGLLTVPSRNQQTARVATNTHLHAFLNWLFLSCVCMYGVGIYIYIHMCYLCLWVWALTCMLCVCHGIHMEVRDQTPGVFVFPPCWDRSLASSFICQVSLWAFINSPASTFHLPVGILGSQMHAQLLMGSGDWNSGLHACMMGSLAIESFSQPAF